jgi:hypothetical protein
METSMEVNQKLKTELSYNPAIPLLDIYPKACKSTYKEDTCTSMFITRLFKIAKLWNHPRCPTTDEWIKKMGCMFTLWIIIQS